MKYRIRATSLYVYTAVIDSDDFPEVFTEEGTYDDESFSDVCAEVFPYGIKEDFADWEFTDLTEIGKNEYEILKHRQEVEHKNYLQGHRRLVELQYKEYQELSNENI